MKPREWWIVQTALSYAIGEPVYHLMRAEPDELTKRTCVEYFQVHEKVPGTITISREEFRRIVGTAMGFGSLAWTEKPTGIFNSGQCVEYLNKLEAELWPSSMPANR